MNQNNSYSVGSPASRLLHPHQLWTPFGQYLCLWLGGLTMVLWRKTALIPFLIFFTFSVSLSFSFVTVFTTFFTWVCSWVALAAVRRCPPFPRIEAFFCNTSFVTPFSFFSQMMSTVGNLWFLSRPPRLRHQCSTQVLSLTRKHPLTPIWCSVSHLSCLSVPLCKKIMINKRLIYLKAWEFFWKSTWNEWKSPKRIEKGKIPTWRLTTPVTWHWCPWENHRSCIAPDLCSRIWSWT